MQIVLTRIPLTMRQLAERAGVSYAALRGWAMGRRKPTPESERRLADALDDHARLLASLAKKLRASAQKREREER